MDVLHLKQTTHEDPQGSTGKSAQRSVITQEGRESETNRRKCTCITSLYTQNQQSTVNQLCG